MATSKISGEAIEYMSRKVYPGDELLTGDNKHYKVKKVDGQKAWCQLLEQRKTEQALASLEDTAQVVSSPSTAATKAPLRERPNK